MSISDDLPVQKKLVGKHGKGVIISSYHQTSEFTLWLQEFQTMYAWNISVIFKDLAALLENK